MNRRYTPYKMFHFTEKLDSLPLACSRLLPPVHVRIKPTNVCAHRCHYCAYRADNLQLGTQMDARDQIPVIKMFQILEDLDEMGVQALTFSGGGDPFYYKPLLPVLKWLAGSPIRFASLTNGAKLEGELAEMFSSHGTWLRVSIDGWDDESYACYRGVRVGAFTRLMNNLAAFARLGGRCHLGVSLIVNRLNVTHIGDLIERLHDIGVESIKVSPCVISNSGRENNTYHAPLFDLVREEVDRLSTQLGKDSIEIFNAFHRFDDNFDKTYDWCPYQQILTVIGADLNVYTCQDKAYTDHGRLGSIREKRFKELWFESKAKFFRVRPGLHCCHHCVANQKNLALIEYLGNEPEHQYFV
jgi:MoaA/NifB/PqqE/SkfB family radical SAM enzyme|tara:strand:- start:92 stop:1159 length:1068 start_codon:yes stop_codon:yes gene_type:complete